MAMGVSVADWFACCDSGAEGPGFKSQPRGCPVTVLGKLFTPRLPKTGISSETLRSVIEYGPHLPFTFFSQKKTVSLRCFSS